MTIAVVTTFPNSSWDIYSKKMLQTFVQYWPDEIPLLVQLDDDLLYDQVNHLLRPQDGIAVGWEEDHLAFVERNKDKDHPTDYRKQAVRFCHKVFAIKRAMEAAIKQRESGGPSIRYLVWMDADVHMTRPVTYAEVEKCLPREGDAVAYLGRKDWDHSECGWLAFDLENSGDLVIKAIAGWYNEDFIFTQEQWHDSYIWDRVRDSLTIENQAGRWTNLTADKPGMDIWPHSPMADWSVHYKGPQAKAQLANQRHEQIIQPTRGSNVVIQTKNAIPAEEICAHILENQQLIKNWVRPCTPTDEEIVIVSAGPMLIPEEVRKEKGKRIIAVKHALEPLKQAGVDIWATILLDPRPHVYDFVENPDTSIIWFVASQVNPKVTRKLLDSGCTVWGYHASVNANEAELIAQQPYAIISGGSATATRGLYLMSHLGFDNFRLYGYDLCYPDKPNLDAKDERGQPKYFEISLAFTEVMYSMKRCFWTEPQLIAQLEEMQEIIKLRRFNLKAYGDGIIPFLVKSRDLADLRNNEKVAKMGRLTNYRDLLKCNRTLPDSLRNLQRRILQRLRQGSRYLRS